MFDNIFSNIQQQQADLQQKLSGILVEAETGDGAVTVQAGADQHIENIKIDASKVDLSDSEQLEDLLVVAVNLALEKAREKAAAETAKLLKDMLPFGSPDDFPKP